MIWPIKRDQLAKCSERDFNESRNATVVAFFSGWVIFQRPMFYGLNNRTRISRQIFDSKTNSSFFAQPSLLPFFHAGDVTSGQMTFYPFCFAPSFSVVHTFLRWKSSEFAVCEGPLLKPSTTDKKERDKPVGYNFCPSLSSYYESLFDNTHTPMTLWHLHGSLHTVKDTVKLLIDLLWMPWPESTTRVKITTYEVLTLAKWLIKAQFRANWQLYLTITNRA